MAPEDLPRIRRRDRDSSQIFVVEPVRAFFWKESGQEGREEAAAKESIEEIVLLEIRLRDSLREMANEVHTKVLDPGWNKKSGRRN